MSEEEAKVAGARKRRKLAPEEFVSGKKKWSAKEDEDLRNGVLEFAAEKGIPVQQIPYTLTGGKALRQFKGAWKEIAARYVPHRRSIVALKRAHRLFDPGNYLGAWSEEETQELFRYVRLYGRNWVKIGRIIGRLPTSCRNHYEHIRDIEKYGDRTDWTKEEEILLIELVKKYNSLSGTAKELPRYGVNWIRVADELGRTRSQCLSKWYNELLPRTANATWNNAMDRKVVQHAWNSCADCPEDIDWLALDIPFSSGAISVRFRQLMNKLPFSQRTTFTGAIEALMKKYQAEEMHQGWEASTGASEPSRESIEGEDEEEEEEDWANIDEDEFATDDEEDEEVERAQAKRKKGKVKKAKGVKSTSPSSLQPNKQRTEGDGLTVPVVASGEKAKSKASKHKKHKAGKKDKKHKNKKKHQKP